MLRSALTPRPILRMKLQAKPATALLRLDAESPLCHHAAMLAPRIATVATASITLALLTSCQQQQAQSEEAAEAAAFLPPVTHMCPKVSSRGHFDRDLSTQKMEA